MPHGAELGVDLISLHKCATVDLPELAARPAAANSALGGAADDASTFSRTGTIPGSPYPGTVTGRVFPHWDSARDVIQQILADSVRNIYDSADALIAIANSYAASDDEARVEMERRLADLQQRYDPLAPGNRRQPDGSQPDVYEDPADRPQVIDAA